jgi:hypothetical protein
MGRPGHQRKLSRVLCVLIYINWTTFESADEYSGNILLSYHTQNSVFEHLCTRLTLFYWSIKIYTTHTRCTNERTNIRLLPTNVIRPSNQIYNYQPSEQLYNLSL